MQPSDSYCIAAGSDTGNTGIFHLKRFWSKAMSGALQKQEYAEETNLDRTLLDILGLGLLPTFRFLYEQRPSFEQFEEWIAGQHSGAIPAEKITACNALFALPGQSVETISEAVLTADDIAFWNEHGYVILKNAISPEDCQAARAVIWEYLQMNENEPATWYRPNATMEGIMLPLYRHPAIDKNRNASRIRRAFEQLWGKTGLVVTTDKCGFNPPETHSFKYRGIGLHWDVSLAQPIPFGTQGILYLTDTAANQGALTVVPGFHKIIEKWLHELPAEINPRETDFSVFGPQPIAANAGDFIIWDHRLPHSSSPNRASLPRLVQYINWYDPGQEKQEKWL